MIEETAEDGLTGRSGQAEPVGGPAFMDMAGMWQSPMRP